MQYMTNNMSHSNPQTNNLDLFQSKLPDGVRHVAPIIIETDAYRPLLYHF